MLANSNISNGHLIKRLPLVVYQNVPHSKNPQKGKFADIIDDTLVDPDLIDLIKKKNVELKPMNPIESSI